MCKSLASFFLPCLQIHSWPSCNLLHPPEHCGHLWIFCSSATQDSCSSPPPHGSTFSRSCSSKSPTQVAVKHPALPLWLDCLEHESEGTERTLKLLSNALPNTYPKQGLISSYIQSIRKTAISWWKLDQVKKNCRRLALRMARLGIQLNWTKGMEIQVPAKCLFFRGKLLTWPTLH